jgi:hypothetical protein
MKGVGSTGSPEMKLVSAQPLFGTHKVENASIAEMMVCLECSKRKDFKKDH